MKRSLTMLVCASLLLLWAAMPVAAQRTSTSSETIAQTKKKSTERAFGKVDINSASQEQLEGLYGIGPVTAKKIIKNRPYKAKSELLTRKIVSRTEYQDIKNNIVARQRSRPE